MTPTNDSVRNESGDKTKGETNDQSGGSLTTRLARRSANRPRICHCLPPADQSDNFFPISPPSLSKKGYQP